MSEHAKQRCEHDTPTAELWRWKEEINNRYIENRIAEDEYESTKNLLILVKKMIQGQKENANNKVSEKRSRAKSVSRCGEPALTCAEQGRQGSEHNDSDVRVFFIKKTPQEQKKEKANKS